MILFSLFINLDRNIYTSISSKIITVAGVDFGPVHTYAVFVHLFSLPR